MMLDVSQVVQVELELILFVPVGPTRLLRFKMLQVLGNDSQDEVDKLDDITNSATIRTLYAPPPNQTIKKDSRHSTQVFKNHHGGGGRIRTSEG